MLSSASLKHFYLLWERNFPVEWPDPSHPGTGHLWRRREIKKNSCQRKVFFSKSKGKSNMWMTKRGKNSFTNWTNWKIQSLKFQVHLLNWRISYCFGHNGRGFMKPLVIRVDFIFDADSNSRLILILRIV